MRDSSPENRMMYYPLASFFGHNATGCINPKKRGHEFLSCNSWRIFWSKMPKGSRRNKFPFWRERRAGRGTATKAMSDIAEERQQSRYAPFAAAARRPAGFVARSSHTAPGIARRSRLASGPGGLQQNGKLFLREP